MSTESEIVGTDRAAEILNRKPATLANWRSEGRGPRFITHPGSDRFYGYRVSDLHDWIESLVPVEGGAQ